MAYEYPTIELLADRLLNAPAAPQPEEHAPRIAQGSDVAVIGLSGRFPGAKNAQEFWSMLAESRAGTGPLPVGRWSEYSADPVMSEKIAQQNTDGGYLEDIASFDAEFLACPHLRRPIWIRSNASY